MAVFTMLGNDGNISAVVVASLLRCQIQRQRDVYWSVALWAWATSGMIQRMLGRKTEVGNDGGIAIGWLGWLVSDVEFKK